MSDRIPMEEWKAKKKAERETLINQQVFAMEQAASSSEGLCLYFYGRGRLGSRLSSGNAALVYQKAPLTAAVKSMGEWNKAGRSVKKGEKGISILVRKSTDKGYYLAPETVFALEQTKGNSAYPVRSIRDDLVQQHQAVQSIVEIARVPVENGQPTKGAVEYLPMEQRIVIRRDATDLDLLQGLPSALVQSVLDMDAPDAGPEEVLFLSCAVREEICGRFGLPTVKESKEQMEQCRHILTEDNVREHFDNAREFAKIIGDQIEQHLPKMQYHTRDIRQRNERG